VPEDDAASDEAPLGRPLPPEDRLWRHPSEVAWPTTAGPRARARGSRLWAVALTSGLTGAVLALGVVAVVAGFGGSTTERSVGRGPVEDVLDTFTKDGKDGMPAIGDSWLGIEGADLDVSHVTFPGVVDPGGVLVVDVVDGGPAAVAGIVGDDVVEAVDGDRVASMADLVAVLSRHDPGDVVTVEVRRGAATHTLEVTLGQRR
jgi:S1-C subfamily serine protease